MLSRDLRSLLLIACLSVSLFCGCFRSTPPAPPPKIAPPVVVAPQPAPAIEPAKLPVEEPETKTPAEVPAVVEAPVVKPVPTERLLLLAPNGPLVIDFELWVDGQPQAEEFEKLLHEVQKLADTDGDGTATWKEVTTSPKFKFGQFGNLPIDRENAPKQIIKQYDLNGDGKVDLSELPRFLTRNAGGARAFSVRSIEKFHLRNRRGSPTWEILDADDDGQLSSTEMEAAATRLRLNDGDDDESLVVGELRKSVDVEEMRANRNLGARGDFARMLGEHANWDSVRAALEEQYGRTLDAEDFLQRQEVFAHLDADKDGKLSKKEFPALNTFPAHLRMRIDFGAAKKTEEGEAPTIPPVTIQLVESSLTKQPIDVAAISPEVITMPGRLILRWPGVSLKFVRNDTIAAIDFDTQAQQGLTMYDADANGYLEASEINEQVQAQFGRFEAIDADADGKAQLAEIAAFFRQRQGAQRVQVHARAQDQEDSLFLALDANADERLDPRELEGAAKRLKSLDANADRFITVDELPTEIALAFARGSIENAEQLFAVGPAEVRAPVGNLPPWFAAMDTSRDGVISSKEFLGSAQKFAALDKNQNGFFEPDEIPASASPTPEVAPPTPSPATETETAERNES
ncbi:hypothetical protein NA78x_005813 [Anatilimnocola sp. NA78]|uniref:hypothetical protein n=1 Tax=Anatilimnocola sp. NA78 TaxID=3415683 RepID=UPI003CE57B92